MAGVLQKSFVDVLLSVGLDDKLGFVQVCIHSDHLYYMKVHVVYMFDNFKENMSVRLNHLHKLFLMVIKFKTIKVYHIK